jgi:hypothetical protein
MKRRVLRIGDVPRNNVERVAMLSLALQAERVWIALLDRAAVERERERRRRDGGGNAITKARAARDKARALDYVARNPGTPLKDVALSLVIPSRTLRRYLTGK